MSLSEWSANEWSAATTTVLALITLWYVMLTRKIVKQNQEILDADRNRETTRRRRMAVSLKDTATELRIEFSALRESYPVDVSDDRIEGHKDDLSGMLKLALDVGAHTETHALEARDSYRLWLKHGRAGATASGKEREEHYERARHAMAEALAATADIATKADVFVKQSE